MKSNAIQYLSDRFKQKYGERWVYAMKPFFKKEKVDLRWVGGHQVLIVDRISKYRNKLQREIQDF